MKMTRLEMVKSIMSDMDSDEVTSITDTVESEQVSSTLTDVFNQFVVNENIPEQRKLAILSAVSPTNVAFMKIPDDVSVVMSFRYNCIDAGGTAAIWKDIDYRAPDQFLDDLLALQTDDANVVAVTDPNSSLILHVRNDGPPRLWTSFDDLYIMVDSYDAAVDTTGIVASKSLCWTSSVPVWGTGDTDVPPLDDNLFPYLLAEAKSTCFVNLKQQANSKIEQQAKKQRIKIQHGKYRTKAGQKESLAASQPNFGRRANGGTKSPLDQSN